VGDHDERPRVVGARFDEQGHVIDDDGVGVVGEGIREAPRGLGAHRGVDDRVQTRDRVVVSEDTRPEGGAIERAVLGDDTGAELRRDGGQHGRSGPLHLSHDGVRVDDDGSVRRQASGDRGLAGGYSPGQSDERHASSMPRRDGLAEAGAVR
jgi:hypothetical protein